MITSSIERAQRKVEENNFGIRKRLIRIRRRHERAAGVIYAVGVMPFSGAAQHRHQQHVVRHCESIVQQFQESRDYEGLKLDLVRILSIECPSANREFLNGKSEAITDKVFAEAQRYLPSQIPN